MKKVITILALALLTSISAEAQNGNENLQREMDQMMQQMQEMMKGFGEWMGDAPMVIDTTILREFHFPADELNGMMEDFPMEGLTNMMFQFSPDSLMNSDMFKGMEGMMQQWSNQDMTKMENFLKDLEKLMPDYPQYEQGKGEPDSPIQKENGKKRKTTTL